VARTLLSFALCALLPCALAAQTTGKISGSVLDENKQPVVGANIVIEGTSMGAATDVEGRYFIINLPAQSYGLRASAVGFAPQKVNNVRVVEGLTTQVDFALRSSAVQMGEVVVEYERPPVQKDLTSKMQGFDAGEIQNLPIQGSLTGILVKQAGITADIMTTPISSQPVFGQFATVPNDGLHFRGGRTNETLYLFDGITVNDGLWGGFDLDALGQFSLQSIRTLTGTFGPQYGEAMSGVVDMQTLDNVVQKYTVHATSSTDRFGESSGSEKTNNYEVQLSGPIPGLSTVSFVGSARRYTSEGYLFGYIYPNYVDSRGQDKSGSPIKVPMSFRDTDLLLGKLIWQVSESMKLRIGAFDAKNTHGMYYHYFKYNPNGTPHVHLNDQLVYGKFTHVLSPSTFYDLSVSRYSRSFKSHVFDTPEQYAVIPQNGSAEFSISGEDWVYFDSFFKRTEITGGFTSQVTQHHLLSLGVTVDKLQTGLKRLNPDGFAALEDYDLRPSKYGMYVNDKMEFDDMGLVVNVGVRYDYVDPNRQYVTDITSPEGTVGKVPARKYFSPRFGISYPISDVAAFRFGYGQYNQYPDFFKAFQGMNQQYALYPAPNVRSVSGAVAKGDIEEERSTNYEVGVQLKVTSSISADITGFYRKISNLIGVVIVNGYLASGGVVKAERYPVFDNINTATVKGIELSLAKRLANNFSGFFNYTYSQALTSSSILFSLPRDQSRTFPADWDQTHTASFGLSFEFPAQWGFSVMGSASSGLPYTYNQFQPNAERAPWQSSLDVMAFKEFVLSGVTARLFVQVNNLLNRKNVWWVYPDSGQPGVDANPSTSDDYTNDPSMWGPGRRVQAGVTLSL
jgi:outer membrane receptor for ferrienterochelin and colicin